jgi:polysaccharide export outer membrane protein
MKRTNPVQTICLVLAASLLFSCVSRKGHQDYQYFQSGLDSISSVSFREPVIKPNDQLSIQIFSRTLNQEQTAIFNIPNANPHVPGHQVDMGGYIELPMVGRIKAAGLTRTALSELLAQKLAPYVKEPSILIRYINFRINVLGEVATPGTHNFSTDRVTLLDAIGAAGDLTVDGKRSDVLVIREDNGIRKSYVVDLRSGAMFQSPAFQLQQNDIVYVRPTDRKIKKVNEDTESDKKFQRVISVVSVATLLINMAFLFRK